MTDAAPELSWRAVCARRVERHFLGAPQPDSAPADVASVVCGIQAQVLTAAELALGVRCAGATRAAIQHALWTERSLVKTYGPRGTVHLLATRDLPLWLGALSALPAAPGALPEAVRLTPEQTEVVIAAIADALADDELTVEELTAAVVARAGAWAGDLVMPAFGGMWPRWRQAMALAAYRGALCFGPNRGRMVTYTSPRRWQPGLHPTEGQDGLAELLRRYLHAYGPATPQQFAQWLAAPVGWAARLFERLSDRLQAITVDGERTWVVSGDTGAPAAPPQGVRLLPYFDAYVVGAHPRARLFPGPAATRALAGGQAGNFPVLLVDGVVGGIWHHRRAGRRIALTVEPLVELSAAQRHELDAQAAWVGAFLGGTSTLTIGPVTLRAHA